MCAYECGWEGTGEKGEKGRVVGGDVRRIWESTKTNMFFLTFLGIAKYSFPICMLCFKKILLLDEGLFHLGRKYSYSWSTISD